MRIRTVVEEYEAKLEATSTSPYPAARGKAEWKVYGDHTRRGRVSVSGLDLPDGTLIELVIEGGHIADLTLQRGAARYKRETERGEDVPWVDVDQILQVVHQGQVLLEARFRPE